MSNTVDASEAKEIVNTPSTGNPINPGLSPVPWRELRERVDPVGDKMPAESLVNQTFIIRKISPFDSSFQDGEMAYYIVGVLPETGLIFNTVLGGQAIAPVLAGFYELNNRLLSAKAAGDGNAVASLMDVGAGQPIEVTLAWRDGGKFQGYYEFE